MRFLIVTAVPDYFLTGFNASQPDLASLNYKETYQALMDYLVSYDVVSSNLNKLGHEAELLIVNDANLQHKWAVENGYGALTARVEPEKRAALKQRLLPLFTKVKPALEKYAFLDALYRHTRSQTEKAFGLAASSQLHHAYLAAQIQQYRPDVLYVYGFPLSNDFLAQIRPYTRFIACQIASQLPDMQDFSQYDLIVSSLPNLVQFFQEQGASGEYLRLGFDAGVLPKLKREPSLQSDVAHVGGYAGVHQQRSALFETVARQIPITFWGYGVEHLPPDSLIRRNFRGGAWGMDMYNVRFNGRINITGHSTIAGRFGNNYALYEATGVGSLLLTDNKENLSELFAVGREIIAYRDAPDCVEKIRYYLDHEEERAAIAQAGQRRVLQEHTGFHRAQELLDILARYM